MSSKIVLIYPTRGNRSKSDDDDDVIAFERMVKSMLQVRLPKNSSSVITFYETSHSIEFIRNCLSPNLIIPKLSLIVRLLLSLTTFSNDFERKGFANKILLFENFEKRKFLCVPCYMVHLVWCESSKFFRLLFHWGEMNVA